MYIYILIHNKKNWFPNTLTVVFNNYNYGDDMCEDCKRYDECFFYKMTLGETNPNPCKFIHYDEDEYQES